MNAAERASEESSAEQAIEWAVLADERTEERMAEYSTPRFQMLSTHCAVVKAMFAAAAMAKR